MIKTMRLVFMLFSVSFLVTIIIFLVDIYVL